MEQLLKILGNAHKSPLTTILGVIMILASLVCVYHPDFAWGWDKAMPGLIIGFTLIFLPDPKNNAGAAMCFMLTLICFFALISCRKPCATITETKTIIKDSIHVETKTHFQTVTITGDSVKFFLDNPCPNGFVPRTAIVYKKKGKASLSVKTDSTGKQEIDCVCADYKATIAHQDSIIRSYRKVIEKVNQVLNDHKPTWYDWICYGFTGIGILLIILAIIIKVK